MERIKWLNHILLVGLILFMVGSQQSLAYTTIEECGVFGLVEKCFSSFGLSNNSATANDTCRKYSLRLLVLNHDEIITYLKLNFPSQLNLHSAWVDNTATAPNGDCFVLTFSENLQNVPCIGERNYTVFCQREMLLSTTTSIFESTVSAVTSSNTSELKGNNIPVIVGSVVAVIAACIIFTSCAILLFCRGGRTDETPVLPNYLHDMDETMTYDSRSHQSEIDNFHPAYAVPNKLPRYRDADSFVSHNGNHSPPIGMMMDAHYYDNRRF